MTEVATPTARVYVDKKHPQVFRAMVAAAEAARGAAADAGLDRRLVELINVRVSQLNGCAYCLDVHTKAALKEGEGVQRLGVLAAWRDAPALFDERERAALALAEATTHPSEEAAQEAAYERARAVLGEEQISAVIWVAIAINAFNRVSILSKHPVRPTR
ncbi:AhpD family alkylhydroperoxidase [Streptomyces sp. TLI_171]|nr:AhpD family alkylhydroperoxidase [Streptomyces sp. TLI_171]